MKKAILGSEISSTLSFSPSGRILFVNNGTSWKNPYQYSCRESADWQWNVWLTEQQHGIPKWIGIAGTSRPNVAKIARNFRHLEKKVKAKRSPMVELRGTHNVGGFAFKISDWWTENWVRRGALTLFMRGWYVLPDGGFWNFLKAYELARNAEGALRHFVDGYTHPRDMALAWTGNFVDYLRENFKDYLSKKCQSSKTIKTVAS